MDGKVKFYFTQFHRIDEIDRQVAQTLKNGTICFRVYATPTFKTHVADLTPSGVNGKKS